MGHEVLGDICKEKNEKSRLLVQATHLTTLKSLLFCYFSQRDERAELLTILQY